MKWNYRDPSLMAVLFAQALLLVALTACSSGSSEKTPEAEKAVAAAKSDNGPGIDLNCVIARLQKPPDSFHYSLKKGGNSSTVDDEAEITPQLIDGSFTSNVSDVTKPPITNKIHAARSDEDSWRMAVGSLGGIMGLAGEGNVVSQNAARDGTEKMNGYDTTKYSVDSTRGDAAGNDIMLGKGGFIKGTAWVTSDGCPVKMSLNTEVHLSDGSVTKENYEENITKKQ